MAFTTGESRGPGKGFAAPVKASGRRGAAGRRGIAPVFRLTRAEERALVGAAQRGDSRALRKLVEFLSGPVYRFGRSFCGNVEDAEDVAKFLSLRGFA